MLFPYRLVLRYSNTSTEAVDLAWAENELDADPAHNFRFERLPGRWTVERIEDRKDETITDHLLEQDPGLRKGTAYCRPALPKSQDRADRIPVVELDLSNKALYWLKTHGIDFIDEVQGEIGKLRPTHLLTIELVERLHWWNSKSSQTDPAPPPSRG